MQLYMVEEEEGEEEEGGGGGGNKIYICSDYHNQSVTG